MGELFSLQEYETAARTFIGSSIHALMRAKDSVLAMIPMVEVDEVLPTRTSIGMETIDTQPAAMTMEFEVSLPEARDGDARGLYVSMDRAADQGLQQLMPHFFEMLSRTSEAVGNVVDGKGEAFGIETLLAALDKLEFSCDEDGNLEMPVLVMHPSMAEKVAQLPPPSDEDKARMEALLERKRQECLDRKRSRRLS